MIIINDTIQIQELGNVFERTNFIRGAQRRCIEIRVAAGEGVTHDMLSNAFADGARIVRRETKTYTVTHCIKEATETEEAIYETEERTETKDYPLTDYVVAGDIIDKRDGSFVVYMGQKTETEILNEEMAELILSIGGTE